MRLVERQEGLDTLGAAMASAAEGHGRLVLVVGEAGLGKTALVRRFTELAEPQRLLWGSCDDLQVPLVLGPFLDIARQAGPDVESVLESGDRQALLSRLFDLLEQHPHPVVLVVDDIHWADQATLDVLASIGSRIAGLPVLMVVTLRPEEIAARPAVRGFLGHVTGAETARIDLAPLSESAIAELAQGKASAGELVELTAGNPLYLVHVLESGALLPSSLVDLVLGRLVGLPEDTLELLELIAIIPGGASGTLLDSCQPGWEEAAEPAEERGILEIGASEVSYRHDVIRKAVEDQILRSRKRRLHGLVLRALEGLDVPPGMLVHHADNAGDVESVLRLGPVAAERASNAGGHLESAKHWRRVLANAAAVEKEKLAGFEEAYAAEAWAIGDVGESEAAARRALEIRRSLQQQALIGRDLRLIARARWFLNDGDQAERLLNDALSALEDADPPDVDELAIALSYRASLAGIRWSADDAGPFSDQALSLLDSVSSDVRPIVLADVGTVDYMHGGGSSARLEQAVEESMLRGLHVNVVRSQVNLAAGSLSGRDHRGAAVWLDQADAFADQHQLWAMSSPADAIRAQLAFEQGRWDEAEELASSVADRDEPGFARLSAITTLARLHVRRGHVWAKETIDEAWDAAVSTNEVQRLAPAATAMAEHAWLLDRLGDVAGQMELAHRRAVESGIVRWIGETAIWLHLAGALPDRGVPVEDVYRLMMEGSHIEAAGEWERLGYPYESAHALVLSNDPERIMGSLEMLDSLGASPLAKRARARLQELGVDRVPRGPRRSTLENAAKLTARQMDVLRLVAEDMTNAEIADRLYLSTRTVDHHVAAILMKLSVGSRHEATKKAREMELLD